MIIMEKIYDKNLVEYLIDNMKNEIYKKFMNIMKYYFCNCYILENITIDVQKIIENNY